MGSLWKGEVFIGGGTEGVPDGSDFAWPAEGETKAVLAWFEGDTLNGQPAVKLVKLDRYDIAIAMTENGTAAKTENGGTV
jgi:hypothetical protein